MVEPAGTQSRQAPLDGPKLQGRRSPTAVRPRGPALKPSRGTAAGRAYLDLQNRARATRRPSQELFQLYVLEAFLDRLSRSAYLDKFALKGGVLLAAFGERRPTRDIDLQAEALDNELAVILSAVREIAAISIEDGVAFDTAGATAEIIRDDDAYPGTRVVMDATLSPAELRFHVDVNVGDPVHPRPQLVELPRLLGGRTTVRGYPLAMVHAEKIVTAAARGTANTRWRDFVDIYLLSRAHDIEGAELRRSIDEVATYRLVDVAPLASVLHGYAELAQPKWAAWRRKQQLEDRVPEWFEAVLADITAFADPIITQTAHNCRWDSTSRSWQ